MSYDVAERSEDDPLAASSYPTTLPTAGDALAAELRELYDEEIYADSGTSDSSSEWSESNTRCPSPISTCSIDTAPTEVSLCTWDFDNGDFDVPYRTQQSQKVRKQRRKRAKVDRPSSFSLSSTEVEDDIDKMCREIEESLASLDESSTTSSHQSYPIPSLPGVVPPVPPLPPTAPFTPQTGPSTEAEPCLELCCRQSSRAPLVAPTYTPTVPSSFPPQYVAPSQPYQANPSPGPGVVGNSPSHPLVIRPPVVRRVVRGCPDLDVDMVDPVPSTDKEGDLEMYKKGPCVVIRDVDMTVLERPNRGASDESPASAASLLQRISLPTVPPMPAVSTTVARFQQPIKVESHGRPAARWIFSQPLTMQASSSSSSSSTTPTTTSSPPSTVFSKSVPTKPISIFSPPISTFSRSQPFNPEDSSIISSLVHDEPYFPHPPSFPSDFLSHMGNTPTQASGIVGKRLQDLEREEQMRAELCETWQRIQSYVTSPPPTPRRSSPRERSPRLVSVPVSDMDFGPIDEEVLEQAKQKRRSAFCLPGDDPLADWKDVGEIRNMMRRSASMSMLDCVENASSNHKPKTSNKKRKMDDEEEERRKLKRQRHASTPAYTRELSRCSSRSSSISSSSLAKPRRSPSSPKKTSRSARAGSPPLAMPGAWPLPVVPLSTPTKTKTKAVSRRLQPPASPQRFFQPERLPSGLFALPVVKNRVAVVPLAAPGDGQMGTLNTSGLKVKSRSCPGSRLVRACASNAIRALGLDRKISPALSLRRKML